MSGNVGECVGMSYDMRCRTYRGFVMCRGAVGLSTQGMSDGVGYVGHVGMSDMSGMSDLSPGIKVSRPIEATSRPHRDSVDAQH